MEFTCAYIRTYVLQMPVKDEPLVKLKDEAIAMEKKFQQLEYETEVYNINILTL